MAYGGKQYDNTNSGALFAREKRSANSADVGGDFILGGEVLDYVKRCIERGEEVKLEMSGWRKISKSNKPFTSLKIDIPWQVKKGPGQPPVTPYQGQQRQQGFGNQQRQQDPQGTYQSGYGNPNVQQGGPDQRGGYAEQRGGGYADQRGGGYDDRGSTSGGRFDDRTGQAGKPEWDR